MISLVLLAATAGVIIAALAWLPGARWAYREPLLGIAAWYATLVTAIVATGCSLVETFMPWPGAHGNGEWLFDRLLAAMVTVVTLLAVLRLGRAGWSLIAGRRRHRRMVRLAGRRDPELDATVIESAQPAAFLMSGCDVVVTSGAVDQLAPGELTAVMAHERAHAAARHQVLLDVVNVAATALPRLRVLTTARDQISRLVEIHADEVAARRCSRVDLARALVAMAAPPTGSGLVSATGGDAMERLQRLMRPPARLPLISRAALLTAITVTPVAPVLLSAACRWWPVLGACLWGTRP